MPILTGNNFFINKTTVDYSGWLLETDPYIVCSKSFFYKFYIAAVSTYYKNN